MATAVDQQLVWYLADEICSYFGNYRNILAIIGTVYVVKKTSGFLLGLLKAFQVYFLSRFFTERNLKRICGGKWAVITGGSDGIGKAFAHELAKYKFNIVLISRSLSKLEKVAKGLETKYDVEVKIISADFSSNDNKIYKDIKLQIKDLDIGLLVNNVGTHYGVPAFFLDLSEQKLWDLVNINMTSMTMITHIVLPGMVERNRGAIINVSSSAAQYPSPLVTVYSATKAYVDYMSQGLAIEYSKNNIVVQAQHIRPDRDIVCPKCFGNFTLYQTNMWMLVTWFTEWLWLRGGYYWHLLLRRWFTKYD